MGFAIAQPILRAAFAPTTYRLHERLGENTHGKPASDREHRDALCGVPTVSLDWNVMPTTRNARGIDLLIYDAAGKNKFAIQVKALSREKPPVPLGHSIDHLMGDFWIIVTGVAKSDEPACFIMKPDEVRQLAHRGEKDGRISYWLQPNKYHTDDFREKWDRIGRGDGGLSEQIAKDEEDRTAMLAAENEAT